MELLRTIRRELLVLAVVCFLVLLCFTLYPLFTFSPFTFTFQLRGVFFQTNSATRASYGDSIAAATVKPDKTADDSSDKGQLSRTLRMKLDRIPAEGLVRYPTGLDCASLNTSKPCIDYSCSTEFSSNPDERLDQILRTKTLSPKLTEGKAAMQRSSRKVSPRKYIFASAASSNHYTELQALVYNLKTNVFPKLSNFTFVVYDIGLSPKERKMMERNCQCQVLDFPFADLPDQFAELRCYSWKPMIIDALLNKSEFTIWMDASIRFNASYPLDTIFRRVRDRGLQCREVSPATVAAFTAASTFNFYGDQACQYQPFQPITAGFCLYHNEKFVQEAVLDPWMACALHAACMCIPEHAAMLSCPRKRPAGSESICHRFDLSSLSIILSKLYLEKREWLRLPEGVINIRRGQTMNWFN